MTSAEIKLIAEKYRGWVPPGWRGVPEKPELRGLGDLVAKLATPVAAALGLPCVDPQTKKLRPESGCAKRQSALNRAVSFGAKE